MSRRRGGPRGIRVKGEEERGGVNKGKEMEIINRNRRKSGGIEN